MAGRTIIDGYSLDGIYPSQFHKEFTPNWIDALLRHRNIAPPRKAGEPFALLDLGCGDGLGLIVIAAAHPEGRFVGIDALPAHTERGAAIAAHCGVDNVEFRCATFAEVKDPRAPEFDYVTGQGILSWVSPENRAHVRRIAASQLKASGVAAFGYNAMPGWRSVLSFQQMVRRFAPAKAKDDLARFDAAVARVRALSDAGAASIPKSIMEWHDKGRKESPAGYFPFEYLTDHWTPFWAADMIAAMADAGLAFAVGAHANRLRADFCLRAAQRNELARIADPALRESVTDIFLDTGFRVDLSVLAPRRLARPNSARLGAWWASRTKGAKAELKCKTAAGTLSFDNDAARATLAVLDGGPAPLDAVYQTGEAGTPADVLNAADALFTANLIAPAAPPSDAPAAAAVNALMIQLNASETGVDALAGHHGPMWVPFGTIRLIASGKTRGKAALARRSLQRLGIGWD